MRVINRDKDCPFKKGETHRFSTEIPEVFADTRYHDIWIVMHLSNTVIARTDGTLNAHILDADEARQLIKELEQAIEVAEAAKVENTLQKIARTL